MTKKHKLFFGVFKKGEMVFMISQPIYCTHITASIIVGILDLAKHSLKPDHYFACDYWRL